MAKRIKGVPTHVQEYIVCLILHLLLPLMPLGIEYWVSKTVSDKSSTLTATMYCIAIGTSSRSRLIFGASIVIAIFLSVAYGLCMKETGHPEGSSTLAFVAIIFIFITHSFERWNRHVADKEPFWEFTLRRPEQDLPK